MSVLGRVEAASRAAARNRRVEALALGLLALLPVVPYLTALLRTGVPREALLGEEATIEQAVRHVWAGDTLLGAPWRAGYHHPGPLFFWLCAPLSAAFGAESTGIFVGACVINAVSAGGLVALTRLFARRAHALAALTVVLAWFAAFGDVSASPSCTTAIVLPTAAFLVSAALLARGKSGASAPAVLFGALAGQTYAAAGAVVTPVALGAVVAFLVGARRRGGLDRAEAWRLVIAATLLLVLFVPPIVEAATAAEPGGNAARIAWVVLHPHGARAPFVEAAGRVTSATAWMPERVARLALLEEGPLPLVMSSEPLPGLAPTGRAYVVAASLVAAMVVAASVARRRRDGVSVALLATSLAALGIGGAAVGLTPGPGHAYLAFWTTAASSVGWIGVLAAIFSAVAALAKRLPRLTAFLTPVLIVLVLAWTILATSLQRSWLARNGPLPGPRPASPPEHGHSATR